MGNKFATCLVVIARVAEGQIVTFCCICELRSVIETIFYFIRFCPNDSRLILRDISLHFWEATLKLSGSPSLCYRKCDLSLLRFRFGNFAKWAIKSLRVLVWSHILHSEDPIVTFCYICELRSVIKTLFYFTVISILS